MLNMRRIQFFPNIKDGNISQGQFFCAKICVDQGARLTASRCHSHDFADQDALVLLPATLWRLLGCHSFYA